MISSINDGEKIEIPTITFENSIDLIQHLIDKQKNKWRLASLDWEDVHQMVLVRIFLKFHTFDPLKGELSHWLSRVVSNELKNIGRNNYTKWARPCAQGCVWNLGGDSCGFTKSGTQCGECSLFRRWKKRKESQHNIAQTLALENHSQETNSIQSDFVNIPAAKEIIDCKMKEKLKGAEWQMYELLYIKNLSDKETGEALGYKKAKNSEVPGYQQILKLKKKVLELGRIIIEDENLA
jgi:hypothetical protein